MSTLDAIPGSAGRRIIDGLKDAVAGNFASVTIEGQRWVRADTAGWQPIETAPKDGTRVLLFTTTAGDAELTEYLEAGGDDEIPLERVQLGIWDNGNDSDDPMWMRPADWQTETIGNPTHWMPLPAPPEVKP